MSKETQPKHKADVNEHLTLDVKRTLVMAKITHAYMQNLLDRKILPAALKADVLKPIMDSLIHFEKAVYRANPKKDQQLYLDRAIKRDKLLDIANVIDCMLRINTEENQEIYEEFVSMVIDAVDKVFYSQSNRRKVHFTKYRLLFKFVMDELHADVNREPRRVMIVDNKEIFFKSAPSLPHKEIK